MFPKNSRRPLTLDHKIRLKKNLAKAYKSAGINSDAQRDSGVQKRRVHQDFKPRPEDKILRKRREEEEELIKQKEVKRLIISEY